MGLLHVACCKIDFEKSLQEGEMYNYKSYIYYIYCNIYNILLFIIVISLLPFVFFHFIFPFVICDFVIL